MTELSSWTRMRIRRHAFLFAGLLAIGLFAANVIALPAFVAKANWDANFGAFAPFAILAIASTPAVMTGAGGLDLSIAPSANLVNVVLVTDLLPHSVLSSPWVAIPILLAMSAGIGLINGLAITVMRVPPVVATVGMLLLLTGLVTQIAPLPSTVTANWVVGLHGDLAGVPWGLILIVVPLAVWGLLRRTPLISTLYLVGGNAPAAYSAGINVTAIRLIAYTLGGLFAGIGGLAITGTLLTSDTTIGLTYALIAMAAVALGGTPVGLGGRGGILGSLCGAATIFLLQNFLIVIHVNSNLMQVAYGALLILGAVIGGLLARPPKVRSAKVGVSR